MNDRYRRAGVPQRFWVKTLEDFDIEPGLEDAAALVSKYIDELSARIEDGVGILFVGPPGWGKTFLASIVLMRLLAEGFSGAFTTFAGYIKVLQAQIGFQQGWQKYDDFDSYTRWVQSNDWIQFLHNEATLVVLDDVGKEHTTASGFAEDEFDFIVRHRFDLTLPTILTSNVPIEEWSGRYTDSMQSFLAEAYQIVRVGGKGDDFRWRRH